MATVHYAAFLAILLAFQFSATTAFFNPFRPPFFGNACEENLCGKGNCTVSKNGTFGYECACERGWRQARSEDDDDLKFLPCVIPNCTLNYTCANIPSPVQNKSKEANISIFDPCFWTDCGGGTCNKTSPFTFACECEEGYYNLLNSTAFPCYKQCSIGGNCQNLGLSFKNTSSSTSPTTNLDEQGTSHAAKLNTRVDFTWSITMVASLALVLRKHI
ncbi:uncharacterized protein [Primulina eburnea]|uniref:uncharacterized protein isoform X1 n=1 Tax=Primulina eburnea TaxID=1245227 RepID=UPI003C6C7941